MFTGVLYESLIAAYGLFRFVVGYFASSHRGGYTDSICEDYLCCRMNRLQ